MKNQSINLSIISWGLFISLIIPMLIDGLHYAIFYHHEEEEISALFQFHNPEESHTLCSYPFVTEEFSESMASISPFERIINFHFASETHLAKTSNYSSIQLRGPPNKA